MKLTQAQAENANAAMTMLYDAPCVLDFFVAHVDREISGLLIRSGLIHVSVCCTRRKYIEYVALTDKGRRMLGFRIAGCPPVQDAIAQ